MSDMFEKKKKGNFEISTRQIGHPSDVVVITPKFDKDGKLDRSESWIDKETLARMALEKQTEGLEESEESLELKRTRIEASDGEIRYMNPAIKEILESENPTEEMLDRARVLALRDISEFKQESGILDKQLKIVEAEIEARILAKKGKGQYKDKAGYVVGLFEVDGRA